MEQGFYRRRDRHVHAVGFAGDDGARRTVLSFGRIGSLVRMNLPSSRVASGRLQGYTPAVRIYLDLCCLKRPFDSQEQPLVRLQTEAVISILALPGEVAELIRAPAQALENSLNPVQARRDAVDLWLGKCQLPHSPTKP